MCRKISNPSHWIIIVTSGIHTYRGMLKLVSVHEAFFFFKKIDNVSSGIFHHTIMLFD